MNLTVWGEDNPALDVESWKVAESAARISEDTTAKQKVEHVSGTQNLFEMRTMGRNESAAKTEQAINSNRRSDSIMLQRSWYFMGGVAVISLLIASTALALVLIIMSQSPPSTVTDPGTVHARSHSSPIDQGIQNLAKSLQKAQIELENIWMVINSTARRTSNLGSKLREETNSLKTLIESLKIQLHKQSLLSQENKTRDLSHRLELTQRELKSFKNQLNVRTVALWNSQNSTLAELDKLKAEWTEINTTVEKTSNFPDKQKIQNLEILINVTRREAEKSNWQHSTALWSAGNFTAKEFRRVWTSVNASQAVFSRELRKVRNNFAQKLNQSIVLLQSSDASLFKSLVGINATIAEKVNNVSKMMGPIGPRGFNGSQGPPGPMGSIGPAGPNGTGDLSTCQYKTKKVEETPGDQTTIIVLNEPAGKRVIGVTCSANYGAENNLSSRFHNNIQQYFCICRKTDAGIGPSPGVKRSCFSHYWQCPLTT